MANLASHALRHEEALDRVAYGVAGGIPKAATARGRHSTTGAEFSALRNPHAFLAREFVALALEFANLMPAHSARHEFSSPIAGPAMPGQVGECSVHFRAWL